MTKAMTPANIENLRVHLSTPSSAPSIHWEHADRRYHVWLRGENLEATIHSNNRDMTGTSNHRELSLSAKKYAGIKAALVAYATPDRIAEARQAAVEKELSEIDARNAAQAAELRAILHAQADLFLIAHDDDAATGLRYLAENVADDDLLRIDYAIRWGRK